MLSDLQVSTALDYVSGTAVRYGAVIDTADCEGVIMIVKLAAVATGGANSIKAQQATTLAFSTPHDITGSAITIADDDDNQIFMLDVRSPVERYVRLAVVKDTSNACAESAIYVKYGLKNKPSADVADLVTSEDHYSNVTGTA